MSLKVVWLEEEGVAGTPCFVAFPGVGDIGILTAELLTQLLPSRTVAHVLDPSLPPLAQLDDNGVLKPPHHRLVRLETAAGPAHVLIGAAQSGQPHFQHATAVGLLEALVGAKEVIGLAGFRAPAEDRPTFWVATSIDDLESFEAEGRTVSRTEPSAGCIGALALLVSLAPIHGLSGSLAVSTTVGESRDPSAAQRLAKMLDGTFGLGMGDMPNVDEHLRSLLEARAPRVVQDHISELMEQPDAFYA